MHPLPTLRLHLVRLLEELIVDGVNEIVATAKVEAGKPRERSFGAVCQLAFMPSTRPIEAAFDQNVMGTAKLLAACGEAGVRKVVLKSSTAVYGARRGNPAFLKEDWPLRGSRRYGYTRDMLEIEAFLAAIE